MSPIVRAARRTFSSLRIRNYRIFLGAQLISVTGTWMQWVAQSWLVLRLTGSGTSVGIVTALSFLPMLIGGAWSGIVADRYDKRRILIITQASAAVLALLLGALTATGLVELWMIYALSLANGVVMLFDHPTRQAFVMELVGPEKVSNAVGLNSAVFNAGRVVGPAVAALLIASFGIAPSFFVNAASYLAVIVALLMLDRSALMQVQRAPRGPGQFRETLVYLKGRRSLRHTLILVAFVATFGLNYTVYLPLFAKFALDGGAGLYGLLSSALAVGAMAGALAAASRSKTSMRQLVVSAGAFGIAGGAAALAPTVLIAVILLPLVGATSMGFITTANAIMQVRAPDIMRGRIMALYALVFLGGTALGGPLAGWVSDVFGPRVGIGIGAAVSVVSAIAVWYVRYGRTPAVTEPIAA